MNRQDALADATSDDERVSESSPTGEEKNAPVRSTYDRFIQQEE